MASSSSTKMTRALREGSISPVPVPARIPVSSAGVLTSDDTSAAALNRRTRSSASLAAAVAKDSPASEHPNAARGATFSPSSKSVSFSNLPGAAAVQREGLTGRMADEAESSADETTVILGAERGGGRQDYTVLDGGMGSATGIDSGGGAAVGLKKRYIKAPKTGKTDEADKETWWSNLAEKYGSVELDNKGSVARDHLALERTFLAWLRTSLSFASIGIAITQLFRLSTSIADADPDEPARNHLEQVGKPLGATFIAISIVILLIGFHRYFESQHYVIRGKFPASRGSIFVVAIMAGALIVASLVVVVVLGGSSLKG